MHNAFLLTVEICSGISVIMGVLAVLVKPIRERIFTDKKQREGMKCLLRGRMLNVYYKHREERTIRQYEYENFCAYYESYKALGGNSFIDHIADEVLEWEVIT
jgi:hypothetical protein